MKRSATRLLRALFAAVICCLVASTNGSAQDTRIVDVPTGNAEMREATAKARDTLAVFWQKFESPGPNEDGFALKVAFPTGGTSNEHIWVGDLKREPGSITGIILNVPSHPKVPRQGQRVSIDETRISDWMYRRAGKIVGNYTMLPLLKRMPPQDAARYRTMLAEP